MNAVSQCVEQLMITSRQITEIPMISTWAFWDAACKEGNDHAERRKEHLWNTQPHPRARAVSVPVAGSVGTWIAVERIAIILQRDRAGDCSALSRALSKTYHRTTASKPAWPFWILHCRWGLRNTPHFWLCFLTSLCRLFFLLHSFPTSPFAALWGAAVGGESLKAPGCCNSYLPEKRGKSQQRNISEAKENSISSSSSPHTQQWCIPGSTRHVYYPLYAQSGKFVCATAESGVRPKRTGAVIYGCMPSCWD